MQCSPVCIKDKTGELIVDLNAAEIRLTESRVGQQVEVSGRLVKRGGQRQHEAYGASFLMERPEVLVPTYFAE